MNFIKKILLESQHYPNKPQEFIAYHSTDYEINKFDFENIELKPNSSARIDGIFFSDIPQNSWGENIYKVKIISQYPIFFDLSKSRFDSLSIQEAFDALFRESGSYLIDDLIDHYDMEQNEAEVLVYDDWKPNLDLIVITNEVYAKHNVEFIVPNPNYNGHSAKIINLGKI